ncbi:hypothetical protein BDY24DRAFT_20199 [Mrakia frigida]|uniref:uncharacterized protein n=1 Tax=Mrakia frigida TaxID=29902 RepID=UPI003FCC25E4
MLAALSLLALVPSALATIYVTQPTPSLPCVGGSPCTIIWAEDTNAPTLSTIGLASVGLWVGSQISQVELQVLSPSVEVAKTGQLIATIDPSVGSNMDQYFLRFTSLSYVDPNSQYGALYNSFSSKFTLSSMTGTFNSTTQALIDAGKAGETAVVATTAVTSVTAAKTSAIVAKSSTVAAASGTLRAAAASASATGSTSGSSTAASLSSALIVGGAVLSLVVLVL